MTEIDETMTMLSAGETDAGSAEVQPARDSRAKATDGRRDDGIMPVIPFFQRSSGAFLYLKKPPCRRQGKELSVKGFFPFHAEPLQQRILLDLEDVMSVTALVHIPAAARKKHCPAILCNHGHAFSPFGKDLVMGTRNDSCPEFASDIERFNCDYGLQMAKRGYVTMAIDYRGFGERGDGGDPYPGRDKCNVHFIRGSLMGYNLLALNIWDARRCLDYLCSLDFVNTDRIGTMGLSFGGTMTTWIALLDERIKATDIICYSCCFKNFAVADGNFCGSQFLPGLFQLCDVPELHGLIAPRPLLAEIGMHDQCFKVEDALECSGKVEKIYKAAGVPDKYEVDLFDGDHRFSGNKAFDFFDKYLKG